ncbi:hypothetical protein AK812_SmicGene30208 [Symbiodinium microadriaticum]|uniref:Uncharacterized protein n=1 Tax=Symbiodinium microadriaticum TaxID=2951 RepID=A0A1Q9CZY1_SYMMI|nr:hypothetical protein AK812_SmicGene30208 [Symbiodinium microadriaticum]
MLADSQTGSDNGDLALQSSDSKACQQENLALVFVQLRSWRRYADASMKTTQARSFVDGASQQADLAAGEEDAGELYCKRNESPCHYPDLMV